MTPARAAAALAYGWRVGRHPPADSLVPEFLAIAIGCAVFLVDPRASAWLLLLPVLIRAVLMGSVAWHEFAHALVLRRTIVDLSRGRPSLLGLLPFQTIYMPGLSDPGTAPRLGTEGISRDLRRRAAASGPAANAALVLISLLALTWMPANAGTVELMAGLVCLINLWILATCWTDYAILLGGSGDTLYCGNFGILAKRRRDECGFLPRRFRRLTERLGQETDVRGQQAGGLAVMSAGGRFVGRKIVNDKRGNLTRDLLSAFGHRAFLRRLCGAQPMRDLFHLVGHYRYGTSSGPSVLETHWHRWCRPRRVLVWSVEGTDLLYRRRVVENLITHNGDFDAWRAPWGRVEQARLGDWLAEVLGERNAAKGDSPKIAGLFDLLHTQGRWDASIRLAYAMQTGAPLPIWGLKELTRVFEEVFVRWVRETGQPDDPQSERGDGRLSVIGCASLADVSARNPIAIQALVDDLWQVSLSITRTWPAEVKQRGRQIVGRAVHAFFHNDLYQAAQLFMSRAEGTFGLVMTTSLRPGAVALAADRQPMFIGADPRTGLLIYASEAAALKGIGSACAPTAAARAATPLLKAGAKAEDELQPIPYRLDLQDGDVALLQVREGTADNTLTLLNQRVGTAPEQQRITPEFLAESAASDAPHAWVSLHENPYLKTALSAPVSDPRADAVVREMSAIPIVLDRVQSDWDDPVSLNRRTARVFTACLLANAQTWRSRQQERPETTLNSTLDLLLLGVENSLYVGQRFIEDVQRVLPRVHALAVDAVSYCEDPQRYALGPETVTLALSHSGQTFNTLDAVKFVQNLHQLGKAGPVFVMTGEIDSLMGAAVGQRVSANAPWSERVFSTWGGWRTAEPATVSTAAMQATLTQLLLRVVSDLRNGDGLGFSAGANANMSSRVNSGANLGTGPRPFGLAATEDDLAKLDALARLTVSRAEALFGFTADGWNVQSPERAGLLRQGRYIARLITEPALAFIATAVHLFVMLWLGWNPVIGVQDLLLSATGLPVFDAATGEGQFLLVLFETAYFLFAGVVFMLILRWLQGRPLWDRVFVGRTLVIGDEPYVKNLQSQFVSKLFSLAYEFSGFAGIHAADTRSGDMLHTYGHRITRGLLLFLGLPDGRWPGRERAEAAVCMTSSQARGVQSMGTGALVFGIGHNPGSACKVDRFVQLGLSTRPAESLPWVLRGEWSELARGLQESRFASFERLLASYVVFHTAAATTRDLMNRLVPLANLLWAPVFYGTKLLTGGRVRVRFGYWDLARTQSGTRIATTAAPVPATNMAPEEYLTPAQRYAVEAMPPALRVDEPLAVPEALGGEVRLRVVAPASGARARGAQH